MDLYKLSQPELAELISKHGQAVRKVEYQPTWDRETREYIIRQGSIRTVAQAAGLGPDITDVTATVVLGEILGLVGRELALRNICNVQSMPNLLGSIRVATKGAAQSNVPAGVEPEFSMNAYTKVDFNLRDYKDAYHVPILDEDAKQANTGLMANEVRSASFALGKAENTKIAALILAATAQTGGDWASTNPIEDIQSAAATIEANTDYEADCIAAHPLVWADYFGSTYVRGLYPTAWPPGKVFPVPGCPGMTGIKESSMTSTIAIVASSVAAFGHGDGPTESEQYRLHGAGADVYLIRHWNQPKALISTGAIRLTGVHV
jgi:hypothetical protein